MGGKWLEKGGGGGVLFCDSNKVSNEGGGGEFAAKGQSIVAKGKNENRRPRDNGYLSFREKI